MGQIQDKGRHVVELQSMLKTPIKTPTKPGAAIASAREAEIRRISGGRRPGKMVCETLSQKKKNSSKKVLVECLKM
jgi:hypothetical protein